MLRKSWILTAVVMLTLMLAGCEELLVVTRQEEYPLGAGVSVVDLTGYNGSIRWIPVGTTERARIEIVKEVRGTDEEAMNQFLDQINIEDNSSEYETVLRAVQPALKNGVRSSGVYYNVYIPPEQVTHFFAFTSNGQIEIQADFRGYVGLRTSNGPIILWSGKGEVDAKTSNGAITFNRLTLTGSSTFTTSNGRIDGTVELSPTGRFVFETSNGYIRLRMPTNTSGNFYLYTSNGRIVFNLGSDRIEEEHYLRVVRGSEPVIDIRTSNGSIEISSDR